MPLDPGTVGGIMLASLSANALIGVSSPQLSQGIANGLSLYASTGLTVITVDAGVLGAGTGTGIGFILPPPTLLGAFTATFPANGILGVSAPLLINALSLGLSQAFATALINTINPIVGVGAGVVIAIPNPAASIAAFIAGFASAGMVGPSSIPLATAIASGLDSALPSGTGIIAIAGSPSIIPTAGAGFGKLS
jgi:hypothetical protein